MMKSSNFFYLLPFLLLSCKKPYNPPVVSSPTSYLVVEGIINSGNDSTIIKLSRTVNLNSKVTTNPVLNASVSIESEHGAIYPLLELNGTGSYASAPLGLLATQKYRLRIGTDGGQHQYLSDYVAVKPTPPIDSIGYTPSGSGIQLYVNAHDPSNSTRYYRWDYDQTWIFHAKYESKFVLDPNTNSIVVRKDAQQVYYCFGNDKSSDIILTSTTKLAKDEVYQSPLTQIPYTSEKLEVKYSILVRQYALTSEAYTFYQNLKKNTEQLGSIFDADPSQISGNIHAVGSAEPVIGYITVTNIQSKRVFITSDVVPRNISSIYPYDCVQDTALYRNKQGQDVVQSRLIDQPVSDNPTSALLDKTVIIGFLYSSFECTDCTLRGTTQTPPFWR